VIKRLNEITNAQILVSHSPQNGTRTLGNMDDSWARGGKGIKLFWVIFL
jgi:hypothetical protein